MLPTDIVGYSKLSINDQSGAIKELNGIVRLSEQFQKAEAVNRILKIPTGDGMALMFYRNPEEPAQCAFEISCALKDNQHILLSHTWRMICIPGNGRPVCAIWVNAR